jgi:2-methylisocitrate lyase-like PEP mutase family enzyme
MPVTVETRIAAFRALHEKDIFVLPNPWDVGGLRRLEKLGARAVASSSAGYAWSLGCQDYQLTRDDVLAHLRQMCAATELPLNADFESGFADAPADVAANVTLAVDTGVAGLSIEDREGAGLYPLEHAVARIRAAKEAIAKTGRDVMLVGRCEGYLTGTAGPAEVIERLVAYAAAGADVLFAPGAKTDEDIAAIVQAVAPKPVNVMLMPGMTVQKLGTLGVRRVSTGPWLAVAAWAGFEAAAGSLLRDGHLPE